MSKYYFGGSGQNFSRGLISEKPFVVKGQREDKYKGYDTLEEARVAAKHEGGGVILYYDTGRWHEVHFIAS